MTAFAAVLAEQFRLQTERAGCKYIVTAGSWVAHILQQNGGLNVNR